MSNPEQVLQFSFDDTNLPWKVGHNVFFFCLLKCFSVFKQILAVQKKKKKSNHVKQPLI